VSPRLRLTPVAYRSAPRRSQLTLQRHWAQLRNSRAAEGAQLHALVVGLALLFAWMQRAEPRFRRALAGFDATYLFRYGTAARQLVFSKGKVLSRRGSGLNPDFTLTFVDLPGALRHLAARPHDVLQLMIDNRIRQSGNKFFIFKLGYLAALTEDELRRQAARLGRLPARARLGFDGGKRQPGAEVT